MTCKSRSAFVSQIKVNWGSPTLTRTPWTSSPAPEPNRARPKPSPPVPPPLPLPERPSPPMASGLVGAGSPWHPGAYRRSMSSSAFRRTAIFSKPSISGKAGGTSTPPILSLQPASSPNGEPPGGKLVVNARSSRLGIDKNCVARKIRNSVYVAIELPQAIASRW